MRQQPPASVYLKAGLQARGQCASGRSCNRHTRSSSSKASPDATPVLQSAPNTHIALHASPRHNSTKISLQMQPSHCYLNFHHNAAPRLTIRHKWTVSFFHCTCNSAVEKNSEIIWKELQIPGIRDVGNKHKPVANSGILFGGGSTNSVEDRGQKERGSGGGSPLVRGSGGSCNLVQEISFHIVKFS